MSKNAPHSRSRVAASTRLHSGPFFRWAFVSLRQHMQTPAPRAVDAWVFRVSLYGLQLARKIVFKFTKSPAAVWWPHLVTPSPCHLVTLSPCHRAPAQSGRDRTRTCDPALIKRML